jgi:hypothetical protein
MLLLGGFVAIWWALMTGVAQADSSPHLVDTVRTQVKAHTDSPVRHLVQRAHHDVKASSSKATSNVRHQARPVGRTVVTVVKTTPVAQVATHATKTIRTTVSETVAKTRSLLTKTAASPVVDGLQDAVKNTAGMPESSTGQGNSPISGSPAKASASSFANLFSSTLGHQSGAADGPDQATASTDASTPVTGPRGTPPVHDPCASPSGSSSSTFTPVGITESSLLVKPSVVRDLHTGRLARLPGGPAYDPGSSPD